MNSFFRFQRGDWNGFWALFADNLANMIILSGALIGIFNFPKEIVFGKILPGLGLSLLFGLSIYAYLAQRLAKSENRDCVTALPYGISTPVMFVYLFLVMGPVYSMTKDCLLAYQIGLAAAFVGGIVEIFGAFLGPLMKKWTPRAGMLGTLAGIAIVWIAAVPMAIIFEHAAIGLPCLMIVIVGLIGRYSLLRIPAGLLAIIVGVVIGFAHGESKISLENTYFSIPLPVLGDLWIGLQALWQHQEIFAIVIPIAIYNFIETMNNVESAQAAGDSYSVAQCQIVDGIGTCVGAVFGAPFPTTVYIGHPAYKRLGAKTGYALFVGVVFFIASIVGGLALLKGMIPEAAVAPLLVFVGVVITQQAFSSIPPAHGIACAFAIIPHIGNLLDKQIMGVFLQLQAKIDSGLLQALAQNQGVHFAGYQALSQGAIITGLLWGAIIAFIIDRKLKHAFVYSVVMFVLSVLGVIHQPSLGWNWNSITVGYLVLAVFLAILPYISQQPEQEES